METIIANPKNKKQAKVILDFLSSLNVQAEIYEKRTKAKVLKSISQGAKEAKAHVEGKIKLQNFSDLLNEL